MSEPTQQSTSEDHTTHFGFKRVREQDKADQVAGVFNSVADKYDLMNDVLSAGMHRLWKNFTINRANAQPGMTVLDIAGGTGIWRRPLRNGSAQWVKFGSLILTARCSE